MKLESNSLSELISALEVQVFLGFPHNSPSITAIAVIHCDDDLHFFPIWSTYNIFLIRITGSPPTELFL